MAHVAVVLAGCGRGDGSEITESVSVLIHLDRVGMSYRCFAPDAPQASVVNHATGSDAPETRNCMVEAARISRGEIEPLSSLRERGFDSVIFPGGFGAAKNLCTFATDGADCTVNTDVARVIKEFHSAGKPIGLICIAPVIAARVLGTTLGGAGCEVTVGRDASVAGAVAAMGSRAVDRDVTETCIDRANRIVTTPAYMCDAGPHDVFTGIGVLVDQVAAMVADVVTA